MSGVNIVMGKRRIMYMNFFFLMYVLETVIHITTVSSSLARDNSI